MKVKVFSTPTCPHCIHAKEFLKEKKVDFETIDVSSDASGRDEMVEKSGQMGVPVIIVENDGKEEVVVGFDKNKLESLL